MVRPQHSLIALICTILGPALPGLPTARAEDYPLSLSNITVRDPFIYADEVTRTYYLYAQTGNRGKSGEEGVEAFRSKDLVHWSQPQLVFKRLDNFWGGHEIWAPEMHKLGKKYYLFVSFNGREGGRGTQIANRTVHDAGRPGQHTARATIARRHTFYRPGRRKLVGLLP